MFEPGSHCVGYRAEKTMFLFKKDTVVGRNCDISAQILPEVGGLYRIEVNVPLRSFNSGDEARDKDVMEILKAKERADLTFRSKALNAEQWKELFAKKSFALDGELLIGNDLHPISLLATYLETKERAEVEGVATIKFGDLGLKPPKVAAGLLANAKEDLELHFHLVSGRILGSDSIRLGKVLE